MAGEIPDTPHNSGENGGDTPNRQRRLGFAAEMRGGFLDLMQRLRAGRTPEAESDDEDDEKKDSKKSKKESKKGKTERLASRAREVVKTLFERTVARPEPIESGSQKEPTPDETAPTSSAAEAAPAMTERPEQSAERDMTEAPLAAATEEAKEPKATGAEPNPESDDRTGEIPLHDNEPQDTPEAAEHTVPLAREANEEEEPQPDDSRVPAEAPPVYAPPTHVAERNFHESESSSEPERVIARDPQARRMAAVNLVVTGMESVGRHSADRKINKNLAKVNKKVDKAQENLRSAEQEAAKTRKAAERMDLWQQAFDSRRVPERVQVLEKKAADSKEQLKTLVAAETAAEKPSRSVEQKATTSPISESVSTSSEQTPPEQEKQRMERLLHPVETHTRPEAMLKTVEVAAQDNVALERLYEQRHERKDEPGGLSDSGGVAAAAGGQAASSQSQASSMSPQQAHPLARLTDLSQQIPPMYRQAAKNGAQGAGVVLAVLALVALL